jgi:hypothetical protein
MGSTLRGSWPKVVSYISECGSAFVCEVRQADPDVGNPGLQLSLRLVVAGRDERAAAVNGDDQAFVP